MFAKSLYCGRNLCAIPLCIMNPVQLSKEINENKRKPLIRPTRPKKRTSDDKTS